MNNEEKTWNQLSHEEALEIAKLCQRLGVTVSLGGVRCLIEVHNNKYGVLVCGKNKTKLSLVKYWNEVREQIRRGLESAKRDVEHALGLVSTHFSISADKDGNEEKTRKQLIYELAKLIKELKEDYEIDGVRCSISTYEEKKVGVLICGSNGAKKSLAKHWDEVGGLIWERVSKLYELLRELREEEEEDACVGRILSWKSYLFIRPIPNLYKEEWLNKYAVIKIIDGVLAGTLIIAKVIQYPTRRDYGIVFKLGRKLYKSIAKHKGEAVRFKILDVVDENQSVAH